MNNHLYPLITFKGKKLTKEQLSYVLLRTDEWNLQPLEYFYPDTYKFLEAYFQVSNKTNLIKAITKAIQPLKLKYLRSNYIMSDNSYIGSQGFFNKKGEIDSTLHEFETVNLTELRKELEIIAKEFQFLYFVCEVYPSIKSISQKALCLYRVFNGEVHSLEKDLIGKRSTGYSKERPSLSISELKTLLDTYKNT